MKRILMVATVSAALACTVILFAADTARERKLQQAIDLIETKGDAAKAVPLLEDVARSSDKALAARGLLYLGQAQERQGGDRARATYQRIVREFSSQKEIAAEAQRRLGTLGAPSAGLYSRKLNPPSKDWQLDNLSRDGQWFGGMDRTTGSLMMQRITTGEIRLLAAGAVDPRRFGANPVVSPDGRWVAYSWYGDNTREMRLMPNEPGAQPRTLKGDGGVPLAWTADGKSILFVWFVDSQLQLSWLSVEGGSVRPIKTLGRQDGTSVPHLAPDGLHFVYSAPERADSLDRSLYLLSADGATETVLIRGGINQSPVWTPDGSRVLFVSNRSGSFDLWSVPVQDGNRAGAPALVKAGTGRITSFGVSPSGTYYYGLRPTPPQIFVAELNPVGGPPRGGVAKLTENFVGVAPSWSRDGKWIAFKRPLSGNTHETVIHSMESGAEWPIQPERMGVAVPIWYLDGSVQPIMNNTFRISMSGGEPRKFDATRSLGLEARGVLSPDDKLFYRIGNRDSLNNNGPYEGIEVLDVTTGQRVGFFPVPGRINSKPALSPDGRTLAVRSEKGIARIGVDGAGYRELYAIPDPLMQVHFAWARDGRSILFTPETGDNGARLMRLPADGGQPEFTGISAETITNFDLSPDGTRVVYAARSDKWEFWALDNVASAWGGR
jgi:Tol biopolymer transport system component